MVFRAYDAIRRPRSQKIVTTSREAGKVFSLQGDRLGTDLEKVRADLVERQKWIWEVDHFEELERARRWYWEEMEDLKGEREREGVRSSL